MMHLAVSEDDIPRAESLVARVGKDYADSSMFAVARGDSALVRKLLNEAKGEVGAGWVLAAIWEVGQWLDRPAEAEPFARTVAARADGAVRGNMVLGEVLAAQGRWVAADSALATAVRAARDPRALVHRGLLAMLPFLAVPRSDLEAIRADLAAVNPDTLTAGAGPARALLPATRLYVLGLLDSRLGEADQALKQAGLLEAMKVAEGNEAVVRSFAAAIRADVALAAHRPADALKALEVVRGDVPVDLTTITPFNEDYARFLRGEALLASGKDDEALRWLENGFAGTPEETWFSGQVAFRRGDIYERRGERQKAIDAYSRFVRLWGKCDPGLRPAVDDARSRLARLTGEPRKSDTPSR